MSKDIGLQDRREVLENTNFVNISELFVGVSVVVKYAILNVLVDKSCFS